MRCEESREIISARVDGEAAPAELAALDLHLGTCGPCRAFDAEVGLLHRAVRVRAAEPVPDLSAVILERARGRSRGRSPVGAAASSRQEWPRYVLLAVALTQLVLAGPALLFGNDPGASIHVARELGSWDIALAIGLLVAAWQPRRAAGLLPMALALAGAMAVTGTLDIVSGEVPFAGEAHHLIDLPGVAALWLLARATSPDAPERPLLPHRRPVGTA